MINENSENNTYLGFDVGTARIGVAQADSRTRIAFPIAVIDVDGMEMERIREIIAEVQPKVLVVGYPRNQSGEPTEQTKCSTAFGEGLKPYGIEIQYQDESLTSVLAEDYLKQSNKPYTKADIDSKSAVIILTDFLELTHGH